MVNFKSPITKIKVVKDVIPPPVQGPTERPKTITGRTTKIKPGHISEALYITINDIDGRLHEIFVNTKNVDLAEHAQIVTRLVSAAWRQAPNPEFIVEELKAVQSHDAYFYEGRFYSSIYAHIGSIIEERMIELNALKTPISVGPVERCVNCE